MKKTIGILGGMGPEATVKLFDLIVNKTCAKSDNENIPVIIHNNTAIPDRSAFIYGNGPSPLPHLINTALKLQNAGADFIIMPCNTAHFFYPELAKNINIPILNMIEETAIYAKKQFYNISSFGLLATLGTYKTGLYEKYFEYHKIKVVIPDKKFQDINMDAIYGEKGIKAGYKDYAKKQIVMVLENLISKGAEAIIAGCSEISLIIKKENLSVPLIDPLEVIATASIKYADYQLKSDC